MATAEETRFYHVGSEGPFGRLYASRFTEEGPALALAESLREDGLLVTVETLDLLVRESRTVQERSSWDYRGGHTWSVYIEALRWPMRGFRVWAIHSVGSGFYEAGEFGSLGAARKRAADYVTGAARGGMYDYDWRTSEWRPSRYKVQLDAECPL